MIVRLLVCLWLVGLLCLTPSIRGEAASGVQVFPLASAGFIPDSVTTAADGSVWFSAAEFYQCAGNVTCRREERGAVSSRGITEAAIGRTALTTFGIAPGPSASLWVTDSLNAAYVYDLAGKLLGKLDLTGPIGRALTPPFLGPDGRMWFHSGGEGVVAVAADLSVNTVARCMKCYVAGGVTAPDGNAWFIGRDNGGLVRVTPHGQVTRFFPGQDVVETLTAGPGGELWGLFRSRIVEYSTVPQFLNSFAGGIPPFQSGLTPIGEALYWTTYGPAASPGRNVVGFAAMTPSGDFVNIHIPDVGVCSKLDRQFFARPPARGKDGHFYMGVGCSPDHAPYTVHGHGYIVRM